VKDLIQRLKTWQECKADFSDDGDSETPDFEAYLDVSDGTEQRMLEADDYAMPIHLISTSELRPCYPQGTQCFGEL
jgi:hypothetical protein